MIGESNLGKLHSQFTQQLILFFIALQFLDKE